MSPLNAATTASADAACWATSRPGIRCGSGEVALTSPEGRAVAARWRVPYPPVLLIEGDLAGYGRLSARALEKILATRSGAVAEAQA